MARAGKIRPRNTVAHLGHAVEEEGLDAHVVVEPLQVSHVLDREERGHRDGRRTVSGEIDPVRARQSAHLEEPGDPSTAGHVGLLSGKRWS